MCACLHGAAEVRPGCCRGAAGEETCLWDCSNSEGRSPAGWQTGEERRTGSHSRYGSLDAPLHYAHRLWVQSGGSMASRWGSGCGENLRPADPERRGWWPHRPWPGRCKRCRESEREGPLPPRSPCPPQNHSSYSSNTAGGRQDRYKRREHWSKLCPFLFV